MGRRLAGLSAVVALILVCAPSPADARAKGWRDACVKSSYQGAIDAVALPSELKDLLAKILIETRPIRSRTHGLFVRRQRTREAAQGDARRQQAARANASANPGAPLSALGRG